MNKWILMVAALCLVLSSSALGQGWTPQARVEVPFEFAAGGSVLPPGTYVISTRVGGSTNTIMLTNKETRKSVMATNIDVSAKTSSYSPNTNLVFMKDESGRTVLHQIWIFGHDHGHDLTHEKGVPEPE